MAKRKRTKGQTTIHKHTYKTKDRVTRTPLKADGEFKCSRRVNLVINPVTSHDWGRTGLCLRQMEHTSYLEGRLRTKLYDKRDDFHIPIVNFPFICSIWS
jgi:hypothetical protein